MKQHQNSRPWQHHRSHPFASTIHPNTLDVKSELHNRNPRHFMAELLRQMKPNVGTHTGMQQDWIPSGCVENNPRHQFGPWNAKSRGVCE